MSWPMRESDHTYPALSTAKTALATLRPVGGGRTCPPGGREPRALEGSGGRWGTPKACSLLSTGLQEVGGATGHPAGTVSWVEVWVGTCRRQGSWAGPSSGETSPLGTWFWVAHLARPWHGLSVWSLGSAARPLPLGGCIAPLTLTEAGIRGLSSHPELVCGQQ